MRMLLRLDEEREEEGREEEVKPVSFSNRVSASSCTGIA
jgi:hypothetical protein